MKKVTAQKVFFWNILGSMSSAAVSVILLFIVTRALNSASADTYSFAYAIANLFVIVASFQVRDFQATDIREKYSFDTYFVTRIISNVAMVLLLVTYLIFYTNTHSNLGIIFWVSFFRVSEALSDVFQGLFQQKERLDIAGKSLFLRNTISTIVFALTLVISKNLLWSVISQTISSFVFIALFDYPHSKFFHRLNLMSVKPSNIINVLKDCLPLFINAFLLVSIYNQPKYALNDIFNQGLIGNGVQRDFSILFTPIFAMNLMIVFLRPMITQLAVFLEEKKMWNKDSGRMYAHNIISWHKDEQITLEQAFEFGKEFAEKWFSGFQTLVAVHKDKEHIHCHLVTNSVSYEDGRKLHNTRNDLERMKQLTN